MAIFEHVRANHELCLNTYRSLGREHLERFLNEVIRKLLGEVTTEIVTDILITEEDKQFIVHFYSYGFVGTLLDWIGRGMRETNQELVERISRTIEGNILPAAKRFSKE